MPPQLCDELVCLSSYKQAANDVDDSRQACAEGTGMEAMGMTGRCFSRPYFPNHIIHLLSPQTVPGFAVFLWGNQPNPSS